MPSTKKRRRAKKVPAVEKAKGLKYSAVVTGKNIYRIRETHIRDHYVPLMKANSVGAVKLDLALRGIALLPEHAGERKDAIGRIAGRISYEDLHDLVRPPETYSPSPDGLYDHDEAQQRKLKREWVREQLDKLEELNLVRRIVHEGGGRPAIEVLRDDGSRQPFDDPTGSGDDSYTTTLGRIFSSRVVRRWGTPEVTFYLAAMIAERHHRYRTNSESEIGAGEWFQPFTWFADKNGYRREGHIRIPFSVATLDRGLRSFLDSGLISKELTRKNPDTGTNFRRGSRNIYTNHFAALAADGKTQE